MLERLRTLASWSLVSTGLFLAACQAPSTQPTPQKPKDAAPTLSPEVAAKTAGWTTEFLSNSTSLNRHVTSYGFRAIAWNFCLNIAAGAWQLDPAKFCPLQDGHHEEIELDYANRRILVTAGWAPGNFDQQNADDRRLQRNIHCTESTRGDDEYVRSHNVCVSAFSKTYLRPASAIGSAIAAPFSPIVGRRQYFVEIDRDAILTAAVTSGAFDQGAQRSRSTIVGAIETFTAPEALASVKAYASEFLALNPDLASQIDQRVAELVTADRETQMKQSEADRRAAAERVEADRKAALAAEKARKDEIVRNTALTTAFRKDLKVGDLSNCGLVMSINRPVVVVQAPAPIGQYGMKISDLFPNGVARCDFYNGVYVRPDLPY